MREGEETWRREVAEQARGDRRGERRGNEEGVW